MKKYIILILGMLVIAGAYFWLQNFKTNDANSPIAEKQLLSVSNYSLVLPEGWSGSIEQSGPYGGPFVDVAILRSPDFIVDPEGNYDTVQQGAEIKIYPPFPSYPNYEDLSQFTDKYNRSDSSTVYSTIAGKPAMTYVWAYEGPILLKTVFLKEKRLYTATLQIAGVKDLGISAFDSYRPVHEEVLNSIRFK